jgi:hypothetical protein
MLRIFKRKKRNFRYGNCWRWKRYLHIFVIITFLCFESIHVKDETIYHIHETYCSEMIKSNENMEISGSVNFYYRTYTEK